MFLYQLDLCGGQTSRQMCLIHTQFKVHNKIQVINIQAGEHFENAARRRMYRIVYHITLQAPDDRVLLQKYCTNLVSDVDTPSPLSEIHS